MKPTIANLPTQERRFLSSSVELRASDDAGKKRSIRGYAAKFDSRSENLGGPDYQFYEIIKPGSFDSVLSDDIRALFNHDSSQILARSKAGAGTLTVGVDVVGLWYEFDAPQTRAGDDILESIRRGDVDQSSFSFTVERDGQKWEETKDGDGPTIATRTITKISRLHDVSPVTYPAYPDATVALRSLEEFRTEQEPEKPEPVAQYDPAMCPRQRHRAIL